MTLLLEHSNALIIGATPALMLAAAAPDSVRNTGVRFSMATPFDTHSSTIRQVFYRSTLMIGK